MKTVSATDKEITLSLQIPDKVGDTEHSDIRAEDIALLISFVLLFLSLIALASISGYVGLFIFIRIMDYTSVSDDYLKSLLKIKSDAEISESEVSNNNESASGGLGDSIWRIALGSYIAVYHR